ncbi:hypothetical protein [Jonesia quinghaiensis]|uniref:hypothetical protein n=1 Tax=Jonesia quinghaiensis TaxID=262806 RepID=UPI0012FAE0B1|nr:hypothetical protein [Jonesia quinghaiensis]
MSFLFIVFLAVVANVVAWLTDWSLLWVLIVVMSTGVLLLYWLESRRRRTVEHKVERPTDTHPEA